MSGGRRWTSGDETLGVLSFEVVGSVWLGVYPWFAMVLTTFWRRRCEDDLRMLAL